MYIWGLHILDFAIVIIYILAIIWLGKRVADRTKNTEDFFLAGRKLGKFYQFFLNFGNSTNADQAVAVARETYRMGVGGMWIQFLVLFITPFYWFTTLFFRRVRLTTIGDFFTERFNSKFLGASYAVFILLLSIIGGGVGYLVAAKTTMAMTPKPIEKCSPQERQSIEQFREFQSLKSQLDEGLTEKEQHRYDILYEKNKKGKLKSFVSYVKPLHFYLVYAAVVAIYTILGGFRAAAISDAIQGILIIIFSAILIPVALAKVGGFSGLHEVVPDFKFQLFGSDVLSEYAWHTIAAMALANLVSIIAVVSGMQTAGSAKNEMTARIGMIGGMFAKRIIMIFWMLAGLLAIALYAGQLHDPDLIWGFMSRDLLIPGAIGLMLVGILAANMSTLDASAVSYSALFVRNLYKPLLPDKTESHYLFAGRTAIGITLLGGIAVALFVDNLLELFKYIISIPAIFGAPIWLGFIWRRLTKSAVIIQAAICLLIYAVIPNIFQTLDSVKYNDYFLKQTTEKNVTYETQALKEDVKEGRADRPGQIITKDKEIKSVGIYFESVAEVDPSNPASSKKVGLGRFHAEIWLLDLAGMDFSNYSKAGLVTTRFIFDAILPFILLFLVSYLTKPLEKSRLNRFFAKMHTPIKESPEEERLALLDSYENPGKFDKDKLFPNSNWEIMKPQKMDWLGFGGSWIIVGLIILLLWLIVSIK